MFIFAAIMALALPEILFFAMLLIALPIAIAFDKRSSGFNYLAFFLFAGLVSFIGYVRTGGVNAVVTGQAMLTFFASASLWKFVGPYLLCGLLYFIPQCLLDTRKFARKTAEQWAKVVDSTRPEERVKTYFNQYASRSVSMKDSGKVVDVVPNINSSGLDTVLVKSRLIYWMTSWIAYWPFYLINVLVADLLREVMHFLADTLHGTLNRAVKSIFASALK